MHAVTLGLGANLGDRLRCLQAAVDLLADGGVRTVASSRVWETEPVGGPPDQPPYLNAVIRDGDRSRPERSARRSCNHVEAELGRTRDVRWGPRTIDIDVLLFDDLVVDEPGAHDPASADDRALVRGAAAVGARPRSRARGRDAGSSTSPWMARARDRTPRRWSCHERRKICLRCDWSGETRSKNCPACGTELFVSEPREKARRVTRQPGPRRRSANLPTPTEETPSARPSARRARARSRGWITSALVGVIVAGAFVFITAHTPAATTATPTGSVSGLNGTLIYAAQDPQGWVLWMWDLQTGRVAPGPQVERPTSLVDASSVSPGWVGVTSRGHRQVASILHFLTPESRPIPDRCRRPRHVVIRRPGHHLAPGRGPDGWLPPARRDRQPCGVVRHLRCPVRRDDVRAPDHDRAERHVHLRGGRTRIDRVDRLRRWRLHGAIHRRPHAAESVHARGFPRDPGSATRRAGRPASHGACSSTAGPHPGPARYRSAGDVSRSWWMDS